MAGLAVSLDLIARLEAATEGSQGALIEEAIDLADIAETIAHWRARNVA